MPASRALARHIDKLARRAHRFHRFAHHPLCTRYAGELIALRGRARVCRGCSASAVGVVTGLLGGSLGLPAWFAAIASLGGLAVAFSELHNRTPSGIGNTPRIDKLWTRGLPAFGLGAMLGTSLSSPSVLHASLTAVLSLLAWYGLFRYRQRGPDRSACPSCPEFAPSSSVPCSGFRSIVRAERAFTRHAQRLLDGEARNQAASP